MAHIDVKHRYRDASPLNCENGYSLVEVVIVLAIIMVMTAIALSYTYKHKRRYMSELQAVQVMDLMKEAADLSIKRRTVVRFEINRVSIDSPFLQMIDERGAGAADDVVIKRIPLLPLSEVRMDRAPTGVVPPNPPNYAAANYVANVWSIRFKSDGSVVNAADIPVSATLYSWRPIMEPGTPFNIGTLTPANLSEVSAVTIQGGMGAVRYWKHTGTTFVSGQ